MKVLFAMGSDQTSKNVADRYYEKYGELLDYKNVFFYKNLIEEVKNNKTYDRIIINEDMEQFRTNDIEQVDRYIFNNIDRVTDEIQDADIIFICADRRTKGDAFINKLFSIGIYNLLLGGDRNINPLCEIIKRPKTKKEAKQYLNIDTSSIVETTMTSDDEVNELQMISILNFYEGIKNQPEKYLETFDRIAEQYSRKQLKIIADKLPKSIISVVLQADRYKFLSPQVQFNDKTNYSTNPQSKNASTMKNDKKPSRGLFGAFKKLNKETSSNSGETIEIDKVIGLIGQVDLSSNANEQSQKDLEQRAREEAKRREEEAARRKAELDEKAHQDAIEREKRAKDEEAHQAELVAKAKAEVEARKQAELMEKAKAEALEREKIANAEAEAKKQAELMERAKAEAIEREQAELAAKARVETEARNQAELAARARAEAEARNQAELAARARAEAEARNQEELVAKAKAEVEAREQAELAAKAKAEAEAREQAELAAKAKAEAEAREQAELVAKAKAEAEAREQAELAAKAKAEAEAREQAELAAKAKAEAEARERAQLQARVENQNNIQINQNEPKILVEIKPNPNTPTNNVQSDIEVEKPKIEPQNLYQPSFEMAEEVMRMKEEQEKIAMEQKKIREAQEKLEEEKRKLKEEQERLMTARNQQMIEYNDYGQKSQTQYTNAQIMPANYKKMVVFVGANKAGTTFTTNAVAHAISKTKVITSILDMTRDKGMFYLYNKNAKSVRKIAAECMQRVSDGEDSFLYTNSDYLKVYTAVPGAITDVRRSYKHKSIIETVKANCNLVIVDADFTTPIDYFEQANEIYIIQDLDVLKIQDVTLFLRELKSRGMDMKKIKVIINRYVKTALTPKEIMQGLSYYNDPEMTYVDELLSSKIGYSLIPYNLNNYAKYIECARNGEVNYKGFSTDFIQAIDEIASIIYPRGVTAGSNKSSKKFFG